MPEACPALLCPPVCQVIIGIEGNMCRQISSCDASWIANTGDVKSHQACTKGQSPCIPVSRTLVAVIDIIRPPNDIAHIFQLRFRSNAPSMKDGSWGRTCATKERKAAAKSRRCPCCRNRNPLPIELCRRSAVQDLNLLRICPSSFPAAVFPASLLLAQSATLKHRSPLHSKNSAWQPV